MTPTVEHSSLFVVVVAVTTNIVVTTDDKVSIFMHVDNMDNLV